MKETIVGTLLFFLAILVLMFAGYGRTILDRIRGTDDASKRALLVRVLDEASGEPLEAVMLALLDGNDPDAPPNPALIRETNAQGEARWSDMGKGNFGLRVIKEGYRRLDVLAIDVLSRAQEVGSWFVLELKLTPVPEGEDEAEPEPADAPGGETPPK